RPILPMRVVLDRNRGGAYLMVAIAGIGMFGAFLFLTYHLQVIGKFTPLMTGLAFLPMVVMLVIGAIFAGSVLLPRLGAGALALRGVGTAAIGAPSFRGTCVRCMSAAGLLPDLLVVVGGLGLVSGPAMALATFGVAGEEAHAASEVVNAAQEVGAASG